jgi:FkbM family methyltransferase
MSKGQRKPKMTNTVSELPDKLLRLAQALPPPVNTRVLYLLKAIFRSRGQATGKLTRIRFGSVEITAPLDHPAVYWRYSTEFNRNYLLVAKRTLAARSGLIIDVGANIGDGVALLRGSGVDAPIIAVEGADIWFELLRSNTSSFTAVTLEHTFLGSGAQDSNLALHVEDGTSKLIAGDSSIPLTTLDSLLIRNNEHPVALLKTDTDGFDAKVLFGAREVLTTQTPVVFAEVDEGLLRDQGNSSEELMLYLSDCGYHAIAIWDNYGKWLGSRPLTEGLYELIPSYPGGPGRAYLDVAVFSERDCGILDSVRGGTADGN